MLDIKGSPFTKENMKLLKKEANRMKFFAEGENIRAIFKKNEKAGFSFTRSHGRFYSIISMGGKRVTIHLTKKEILRLSEHLFSITIFK